MRAAEGASLCTSWDPHAVRPFSENGVTCLAFGSGDRLQASAQPFIPPPAAPSQSRLRGMSSNAQPFVPQGPTSGTALAPSVGSGRHRG